MAAKSAHQIRFCLSDLERKDVAEQAAASLIKLVLDDPNSTRVNISLLLTGKTRPPFTKTMNALFTTCLSRAHQYAHR